MFKKSQSYIGVDIGSTSVKIVELQRVKGKPRLVNYGYSSEVSDFSEAKNLQLQIDKTAKIINKICDKAGIKSRNAVAGLPSFAVFSSIINVDSDSKKDIGGAVMWEAKKVVPLDLDEMILDWKIIGPTSHDEQREVGGNQNDKGEEKHHENTPARGWSASGGKTPEHENTGTPPPPLASSGAGQAQKQDEHEASKDGTGEKDEKKTEEKNSPREMENAKSSISQSKQTKILLTGAPKSLVKKYIDIFQIAKINLLSLETEIFSMIRALVGNDPAVIAIVDMGAVNTDIAIAEKGMPMFSRSLDTGGIMITKAISDSLKVDFKRAEQFKFDISSLGWQEDSQDVVPKVIKEALAPIVNEIRYSLNSFQEKNNKKIEKVIISAGGANLANITDYLGKVLDMKVIIGDPWARVVYPLDLKPVLDEIGSKMAVAVGLALREVD